MESTRQTHSSNLSATIGAQSMTFILWRQMQGRVKELRSRNSGCRRFRFGFALLAMGLAMGSGDGVTNIVTKLVATNYAGQSHAFRGAGSYRIESLYSNQAGWFQYIELRDASPGGKPTPLAGSVITVRHGNVIKRYVIATDPPAGFPPGGSLIVSSVADWSSDDFGPVPPTPPDYVMPVRFLPTDGGTIELDGQDPWTFDALPTDGSTALLRSGGTVPASGHSFALGKFSVHAEYANVDEYYNAGLDRFFITGSEPDLDAIDSGRIIGWAPTGYSLGGLSVPTPRYCCSTYGQVAVPVCRSHLPPSAVTLTSSPPSRRNATPSPRNSRRSCSRPERPSMRTCPTRNPGSAHGRFVRSTDCGTNVPTPTIAISMTISRCA